jgi:transcriptional regulator with XRE-family HTH domain
MLNAETAKPAEKKRRSRASVHVRMGTIAAVGTLIREWRERRRLTQLALACEAEISTRHLSFMETGRSIPSREMILLLSAHLDVPMRERNVLLVAAGYAPCFSEKSLDDPGLAAAREAIALVLEAQKPYPAFAIDRHWTLVASNHALPDLYDGVSSALLQPPVNGLRLTLHPAGLAPRIANLAEWRAHLLERLRHQIDLTADRTLIDLMREVSDYPSPATRTPDHSAAIPYAVAVPFRVVTNRGLLSFFSTTTVFGTPVDVTLSELALECFYPADASTAEIVRAF